MPYTVNFTDRENKSPVTVFDNTENRDTSIIFPGRNVTGYGQIIADNFLHLLENFASGAAGALLLAMGSGQCCPAGHASHDRKG